MKVIIIDDDPLVRDSLCRILRAKGMEVTATGNDGEEAPTLYERFQPDVLLMDIRMQNQSGLDAARKILSGHPEAKILLITTFRDEEYIQEAISLGCSGYILKQNIAGIVPAIEAAFSNQLVFDLSIVEKLSAKKTRKLSEELSPREKDILRLVAEGLSNREIAGRLFLSEGTVRNYISSLLEKLGLRDRTQLAIYYYKN